MRRPEGLRTAIVSAVLLFVAAAGAAGQTVEFRRGSRGDPRAEQVLKRVLDRGNYQVLTRDTILAAEAVLASDVILLGATLRVEGRIAGDLVAVQSDIFARPGGRFEGTVAVLAGGFYGSSLAELNAPLVDASRYDYRLSVAGDEYYVIAAPGGRAALQLPGLYGFLLPQYDRVNAVTVPWGVDLQRGPSPWIPEAKARVRYRSVRSVVDGDLEVGWPFGRHRFVLNGGRTVRSNDRWANGDLESSLYALIGAVDTRNYYDARFVAADLKFGFGTRALWAGDVVLSWERARSLENRDPFSLFEVRSGYRPNLPVDEADIASIEFRGEVELRDWPILPFELELGLEHADADVAGDLSFTLIDAALLAELSTWGRHALVIEGRGQLPASSSAPRQRWRALGGWGTLPTLVPVDRAGDRMWWVGTTYRAPLGQWVGARWELVSWLQYAAGNAWADDDERPPTVHNLAFGLSLGPLSLAVYTAPSDDFKTVLAVGVERYR